MSDDPATLARRVLDARDRGDATWLMSEAAPVAEALLAAEAERDRLTTDLDHLRSDAGPDSCADRAQRHARLRDAASAAIAQLSLSPDPGSVEQAIAVLRRGFDPGE